MAHLDDFQALKGEYTTEHVAFTMSHAIGMINVT